MPGGNGNPSVGGIRVPTIGWEDWEEQRRAATEQVTRNRLVHDMFEVPHRTRWALCLYYSRINYRCYMTLSCIPRNHKRRGSWTMSPARSLASKSGSASEDLTDSEVCTFGLAWRFEG